MVKPKRLIGNTNGCHKSLRKGSKENENRLCLLFLTQQHNSHMNTDILPFVNDVAHEHVYSVLPVELAPPPVISYWGRFDGWYSASDMVDFNFVCDFSGLLKWRKNWWSRLRPRHVKLQILKKNAALCLANDPLGLLNKTRNSSLRHTSHQVQALGSGLIILYLPLCKVDCIRMV